MLWSCPFLCRFWILVDIDSLMGQLDSLCLKVTLCSGTSSFHSELVVENMLVEQCASKWKCKLFLTCFHSTVISSRAQNVCRNTTRKPILPISTLWRVYESCIIQQALLNFHCIKSSIASYKLTRHEGRGLKLSRQLPPPSAGGITVTHRATADTEPEDELSEVLYSLRTDVRIWGCQRDDQCYAMV